MYDDIGKLILRVNLGVLILFHGVYKLQHGIDHIEALVQGAGLPTFFAWGNYLGEVVGPVLLIIGLFARVGAGLIALNMIAAILLVHLHELTDLTEQGGYALELQAMFLFTAIALVFTGPGRHSIDQRW